MTRHHYQKNKNRRADFRHAPAQTCLWLVLCIAAPSAMAQDETTSYEGRLEIGVGRTDNLNHDDTDEIDADIGMLALGFAGRADRRWLRATLAGDIEYEFRRYDIESRSDDDDEVLGSIDGAVELQLLPERFQWDFGFDYGHARIDPLGSIGPRNRQRTTSTSTGPKITFPIGQRTVLRAAGSISDQEFDETQELDARSKAARLGFERELDSVTRISLALDRRETEYDQDEQEHDIETVSIEYRRELATGEALASIGRGRLEVNGESFDPITVGRLVWNRAIGARSQIEVCVGREITDAGFAFESAGVAVACPGEFSGLAGVARTTRTREQGVVATTNPLVRHGGSVSFELDGTPGGLRATFSLAQDRFEEDTTYDNNSTIFEIAGWRDFAVHWRAELAARLWVQDFKELGTENEDRIVRLSVSRFLARNMRLTLTIEQDERVGGIRPFEANEYFLSFSRSFGR